MSTLHPSPRIADYLSALRRSGARGVYRTWQDAKPGRTWRLLPGRIVEILGNKVRVEGLWFDVSHPTIKTLTKSELVFGTYEEPERRALHVYLDPALPVVELGGSIGVVACLTNRRLANPKRHVVVEANPDIVSVLTENRRRNGCAFTIEHCALSYDGDHVSFFVDPNILGSRAHPHPQEGGRAMEHEIRVRGTTLRKLLDDHDIGQCTLVCDIEGSEWDLVEREGQVLRDCVTTFMVEMHPFWLGADRVAELTRTIEGLGFTVASVSGDTMVFVNESLRKRPNASRP